MAEQIFFAVNVDTGESIKDLEKLRGNFEGIKNEIKSIERARKRGTITSKEANKQTAALNVELAKSRKAYNDANRAAAGLGKVSSGLTKTFKQLGTAIAGAFAAQAVLRAIGNTIDIIKDFEQANADLASVLGVTTKETERLQEQQLQLGATTSFTASEIAGLQKELAKLGFTEAEIIASTEAIQQLAAATNTDLAEAASVAASTVKGFGLTAEETQRVVDVMAKSFSSSALDMQKFSTAMAIVAPVAKNAGFTIEETTAQIGILADRGVDASSAATALRNIFLENAKAGRTFEQGLQLINQSTNKSATAFELFGKRGATVATILAENADQASLLEDKLIDAGGAAEEMAETQLDTLTGRLKLLNSAWEGFILSLEKGDGVMGELAKGGVEFLTTALTQLTNIGSITEVMFRGIEGASMDSRKAIIQNADALNIVYDNGVKLSDLFKEFNDQDLVELEANLGKNQIEFIQLAMAQGENAVESRLLFDAYLELRRETEKGIFTKDEETEATQANTDAKAEAVKVETDLIKLKKQEIKDAKAVTASTKEELEARNLRVATLEKELKLLKSARPLTFNRLKAIEAEKLALMDAEDESVAIFEAETDRINTEIDQEAFRQSEKVRLTQEGLTAIQNLTNVFTENKLKDLDRETRAELSEINKRERQGLITRHEAEQARRKLEEDSFKKSQEIEKKAFNRNKAFNIAQATIDTSRAIVNALANIPAPANIPFSISVGALGAVQVASIAAQKFAKGGIIEGASHDQGGVPIMGGRAEVEGGEIILTKGVTENPTLRAAASQLNVMGGGQSFFQQGGILPNNLPTFALPETSGNNDLTAIVDAISNINLRLDVQEVTNAQNNIRVAEIQSEI